MSWAEVEAVFAGRSPAENEAEFRAQFTNEEWAFLAEQPEAQAAYRLAFTIGHERAAGQAPSHYTARTVCRSCGPVPIWQGAPAKVLGCPWCCLRPEGGS